MDIKRYPVTDAHKAELLGQGMQALSIALAGRDDPEEFIAMLRQRINAAKNQSPDLLAARAIARRAEPFTEVKILCEMFRVLGQERDLQSAIRRAGKVPQLLMPIIDALAQCKRVPEASQLADEVQNSGSRSLRPFAAIVKHDQSAEIVRRAGEEASAGNGWFDRSMRTADVFALTGGECYYNEVTALFSCQRLTSNEFCRKDELAHAIALALGEQHRASEALIWIERINDLDDRLRAYYQLGAITVDNRCFSQAMKLLEQSSDSISTDDANDAWDRYALASVGWLIEHKNHGDAGGSKIHEIRDPGMKIMGWCALALADYPDALNNGWRIFNAMDDTAKKKNGEAAFTLIDTTLSMKREEDISAGLLKDSRARALAITHPFWCAKAFSAIHIARERVAKLDAEQNAQKA